MVRSVRIEGASVTVEVALTVPGCPLKNEIQRRVGEAVHSLDDVHNVDVTFDVMSDEERARVRELMVGDPKSTAGSQAAHGPAEGRAIPFADAGSKTRVLLVASGTGGVGQSSVTPHPAVALATRGKHTPIVHAGLWGAPI